MWDYIWNDVTQTIAAIISVFVICYYLHKLCSHLSDLSKKLSQDGDTKNASTVLLPVTKMDLKAECTTVLPMPIGAEMCHHKMEVIANQTLHAKHEEKCVIVLQCTLCGTIDKTIAVTSPIPVTPPPPAPKSECRHSWAKEKTITLSSAFEQMEDVLKINGKTNSYKPISKSKDSEDFNFSKLDLAAAPAWMFRKTVCIQRICTKCGEVDRAIMSNFEIEENKTEENQNNLVE